MRSVQEDTTDNMWKGNAYVLQWRIPRYKVSSRERSAGSAQI